MRRHEPDRPGNSVLLSTGQQARVFLIHTRDHLRTPGVRRLIALVLNLAMLSLLLIILYQSRDELPQLARQFSLRLAALAGLCYAASFTIQWLAWADLSGYRRYEWRDALDQYVRTTFMARLPGGLWKIAGRMTVYRAPRISPRAALAVALVELALLLATSAALLLLMTSLDWWLRAGGGLALVVTLAVVASRTGGLVPGLQRGHRWLRWPLWSAGYALSWISGGLMVYLMIRMLGYAGAVPVVESIKLWCISGAAGLALQFIPVSALFRDGTLVVLLQPLVPLHIAVLAALLMRLAMMVFELATGWALLGLLRLQASQRILQHPEDEPERNS
jgi:hypothetical protein